MSNEIINFPVSNLSNYSFEAKKNFMCRYKVFIVNFINSLKAPTDFKADFLESMIVICFGHNIKQNDRDVDRAFVENINNLVNLNTDFLNRNIDGLNEYWKTNPIYPVDESNNGTANRLTAFPPTEPGNDEPNVSGGKRRRTRKLRKGRKVNKRMRTHRTRK